MQFTLSKWKGFKKFNDVSKDNSKIANYFLSTLLFVYMIGKQSFNNGLDSFDGDQNQLISNFPHYSQV